MTCKRCGADLGDYTGKGKPKQYCDYCALYKQRSYLTRYKARIREFGEVLTREDKTDAELAAIKEKCSQPKGLDFAINRLAEDLAGELIRNGFC